MNARSNATGPLLASLLVVACSAPESTPPNLAGSPDLAGPWRAVLASPGGELPFTLEISGEGGTLEASIANGDEHAPTTGVEVEGNRVTIGFDWYDSRIVATLEGDDGMRGEWTRASAGGTVSRLPFSATRGVAPRFRAVTEDRPAVATTDIGGVWRVEFTDEDGTEPAQGEFVQDGTRVTGTFLTPTGDYRFLEGSYEEGLLRLSTFDGAHAFLFSARVDEDSTLTGDFWSRDSYHATWTASRAEEGEVILPDAWNLAGLTNDEGSFSFSFADSDGNTLSSDDPRFDGKVVLVNIFGTWCPNCNDKAPLLAEWHDRWADRGLEIVGLAYEFSGDPERDRLYVSKFAERHGIAFPLLLAGISDKAKAAETLPDLNAVIAFPTTVFIGRDGRVRKIHSGFSGPGTGSHYDELVAELEGLIETLLDEPA